MGFCSTPEQPQNQLIEMPTPVGTNPDAQTPYQDTPYAVSQFANWLKSIGADEYQFGKDTYRPIEQQLVRDAQRYASPEYAQEQANIAGADVSKAFDDRRQAAIEDLSSRGLGDPSSGAYRSLQTNAQIAQGGATAAAKNAARRGAQLQGFQTLAGLANMGNQKTAAALGAMGTAGGLANSAYGITSGNRNYLAGLNQAANLFNVGANQRAQMFNAGQRTQWDREQDAGMGGFGNLLGTIGGTALGSIWSSSKKIKRNRRHYKGGLDAIKKMPIQKFRYKPGMGDDMEHVGPMAEDFHKATGHGDGQTIPVQDAMGVTMAAVHELNEKVSKLEGKRRKRTSDPESELNQEEVAA